MSVPCSLALVVTTKHCQLTDAYGAARVSCIDPVVLELLCLHLDVK